MCNVSTNVSFSDVEPSYRNAQYSRKVILKSAI